MFIGIAHNSDKCYWITFYCAQIFASDMNRNYSAEKKIFLCTEMPNKWIFVIKIVYHNDELFDILHVVSSLVIKHWN